MKILILLICFCKLVSAQTGLGGVGSVDGTSALNLWLKVDAGLDYDGPTSNIELWTDQSGSLHTVSQDISSRMPTEITNTLNGFSVLRFDRKNDNFLTSPTYAEAEEKDITIVMVFSIADTLKNRSVFASRNSNGIVGVQLCPDKFKNFIYKGNGGNYEVLGLATDYATHQIFYLTRNSSDTANAWSNGSAVLSDQSVHTNLGKGFEVFKFGTNFTEIVHTDMDLAEAAVYYEENNEAQRIIVQNYLSSKYGISLAADDNYNGDLAANGDFDYDVIGVGQAGGTTHAYSESPAGIALRIKSGFIDDDYVFLGHDNTANDLNTTDIGGVTGLQGRWGKTWYADVTGAAAPEILDVSFDFSEAGIGITPGAPSNYKLLFRSGTTGDWSSLGDADSVVGDRVYFTDMRIGQAGDGYMTLGSSDLGLSPLPVELVSFSATVEDLCVQLNWETATETGTSHFDVERTIDGEEWAVLGTVEASGNSTQPKFYQFTDRMPAKRNYYRLIEVDLNGEREYSHLIVIDVPWIAQLNYFPNPASDKLYAGKAGSTSSTILIEVYDLSGSLLRQEVVSSSLSVDLTELSPGSYIVRLKDGLDEKTGQLLIQR